MPRLASTLGGIYACFGDTALPGKFLRQAAANRHVTGLLSNVSNVVNHRWQGAIPDYSLWWVMGLWNHYLYTGEERWIHALYPAAVGILDAHLEHVNERGLVEDMPYWVFIDWADVDRRGECAALNAILCGALDALEKMAGLKGDEHTRRRAAGAAARMRGNFRERFFDPARGCLADARIDGEFSEKTSEHANAAAILWGLVDEAAAGEIVRALFEECSIPCTEAQPFFMVVVLGALRRLGRLDLALELIRRRWGGRMLERGATSTYEEWYINGSWRSGEFKGFMRTLSHAWSACPAEFLIRDLAGVEILEPGCSRVRVLPHPAPFDYTSTFPTPRGAVVVTCRGGRCEVAVPDGVELIG